MGSNAAIRSRELMELSEAGFNETMRHHAAALRAKPNGEVKALQNEIASFERTFSMTTAEMRARLENGALDESHEICRWLMRASLLDRLRLR